MKANEFVKKFGLDRAKREVALIGTIAAMCCDSGFNDDLKRIVESWELVESLGGLDEAKEEYQARVQNNEPTCGLAKTIEDVESCK